MDPLAFTDKIGVTQRLFAAVEEYESRAMQMQVTLGITAQDLGLSTARLTFDAPWVHVPARRVCPREQAAMERRKKQQNANPAGNMLLSYAQQNKPEEIDRLIGETGVNPSEVEGAI